MQSSQVRLWGEVESQQADAYDFNVFDYYEDVPATFFLPKGVPVPAGEYRWTEHRAQINTTRARWYPGELDSRMLLFLQRQLFQIRSSR